MTYDAVHQIARGRVWTGADAIKIGLVDTLGGLDLAMSIAAQRAGISDYRTVNYPKEKDTWTQLSELFGESDESDLDLAAKVRLAYKWRCAKHQSVVIDRLEQDLIYISTTEGLQARMPFVVVEY